MQLYALKAILPHITKHMYIFQSNKLFKNEYYFDKKAEEKYYSYMLSQIQNDSFCQTDNEHLYVLKIESENIESLGLIAKLDIKEIKNILYLHEETIDTKVQQYAKDLLKYDILTSPLIMSHNESSSIDNCLKNETKNSYSIEININSNTYKIWKSENNKELKDLFIKEINYLFLADGHHRLKALEKSNKDFLYAYIISNKYLKSKNIFRVYENINAKKINDIIEILLKNYDLKKSIINYNDINNLIDTPALIYDNKSFFLNGGTQNFRAFLEQIYQSLSFNRLNFTNYNHLPDLENIHKKLCIFIPKINVDFLISHKLAKFSPHSSYFEPKIPDGLLSMLL